MLTPAQHVRLRSLAGQVLNRRQQTLPGQRRPPDLGAGPGGVDPGFTKPPIPYSGYGPRPNARIIYSSDGIPHNAIYAHQYQTKPEGPPVGAPQQSQPGRAGLQRVSSPGQSGLTENLGPRHVPQGPNVTHDPRAVQDAMRQAAINRSHHQEVHRRMSGMLNRYFNGPGLSGQNNRRETRQNNRNNRGNNPGQ